MLPSGTEIPPDYMKINSNFAITKILEEIMKGHPAYSDKKFDQWKTKVTNTLKCCTVQGWCTRRCWTRHRTSTSTTSRSGPVWCLSRVTSTPYVPRTGRRSTSMLNPYKVHAYSLAIPGVSTGQNFKNFVFKTYNYIFTGDNVDVMDLNINYKVAYFQSRLKDFEATDVRKNTIEDASDKATGVVPVRQTTTPTVTYC